ncbi:hypothetical protein [Streptomyces sp. DT171]|uniref:hypothetical protein n=1 Tax=Streptomyces sp. DT171 TaxID=3416524 RepID=UPI003CED7B13
MATPAYVPLSGEPVRLSAVPPVRGVATAGRPAVSGGTRVPLDALVPSESPRLDGEDLRYVGLLAALDTDPPPLLVHRATMRVVDGRHRLRAARLRGERDIAVTFWDGPEDGIWLRAVEANTAHGLPLSHADRRAAAARILAHHPDRSDRAVARTTGLSPKTVAVVRRCSTEDFPRSNKAREGREGTGQDEVGRVRQDTWTGQDGRTGQERRIGQDGRTRPVGAARGREAARDVITRRPQATLREVAAAAGISLSTAHDVRQRMRRGEDPVSPRRRRSAARPGPVMPPGRDCGGGRDDGSGARDDASGARDQATILRSLLRDPSLKLTESGRALLRWLAARAVDPVTAESLLDAVPAHAAGAVADLAHDYALVWERFARSASRRAGCADAPADAGADAFGCVDGDACGCTGTGGGGRAAGRGVSGGG